MSREELKRLWFSLDHSNTPIRKQIIVDKCTNPYWPNHAKVEYLKMDQIGILHSRHIKKIHQNMLKIVMNTNQVNMN